MADREKFHHQLDFDESILAWLVVLAILVVLFGGEPDLVDCIKYRIAPELVEQPNGSTVWEEIDND